MESESSDEEWVFSSTKDQQKPVIVSPSKPPPSVSATRKPQKFTISEASLRTIRANIPKSSRLPPFQPQQPQLPAQIIKTVSTTYLNNNATPTALQEAKKIVVLKENATLPSLQFISDQELQVMCTEMNANLLVTRLVNVYKSSEIFIRIREIETQTMSIESRLRDHLYLTKNPSDFVLNVLSCLSRYFSDNPKNKDLTPKFRRLLATTFCTALARFFEIPEKNRKVEVAEKKEDEPDLITFDDQQSSGEVDLISFDDISITDNTDNMLIHVEEVEDEDEEDEYEDEEDEYESDSEEEVIITLSDIRNATAQSTPPTTTSNDKYTLTRDNQLKLISMIDLIPSPVIVYYAMDIFKLVELVSFGCDFEEDGVKLCRALFKHGHYEEYVVCIKKLNLYPRFPTHVLADQLFTAGYGMSLPTFIQGQPILQKELLSFINKQLRFNYAGNLGIVPTEQLADLIDGSDRTPQLSRLKERKFQKDLVNCGAKILKDSNLPDKDYYFIHLSQRYACLRFILTQRAIQQAEDGDLSIEASSNFNGLIDLVCEDDPILARLAIKELIDTGDTVAPPYFASLYKQQEFYCRYNALPLNQRLLGIVKGEQMSRHRSMFTPKKVTNAKGLNYYTLPSQANYKIVDSHKSLMHMKDILSTSNICGIDTEWVPAFAKSGVVKTALMQISCDIDGFIFLLDLKTIFDHKNDQLYKITEKILEIFFEDDQILKIAYDFTGDFDLLHTSIPSSKNWRVSRLLDFKSIKSMPKSPSDGGETISGGLAGLASFFLGVTMNKRQQLSNWEKRPLTEEQAIYAACDAYCLLDIYYTLVRLDHPYIKKFNGSSNSTSTDLLSQ